MRIALSHLRATSWLFAISLWIACVQTRPGGSSWTSLLPATEALTETDASRPRRGETASDGSSLEVPKTDDEYDFDEDELVRETIEAGRGDREERGVRDQWTSDEHLGRESAYDSRKPVSAEIRRLLEAYRLTCDGCDHDRAVRKVNAYVRETKRRLAREEREARERRESWARRILAALAAVGLSVAYAYREDLGLGSLLGNGKGDGANPDVLRLRRQQAADAASKRQHQQQEQKAPPPTWLDNEKKETWSAKQEKQFQQALKEFGGVPKKERYQLIAEKVQGKSRIECLTHHRMQELLAKYQEQQQQQ